MRKPAYFDCNATTPIEPSVRDEVMRFMTEEFGNAGSRTHEYGSSAKRAVNVARQQVSEVVRAKPDEVIFTSGATESNNLAILGLAHFGEQSGKRHIVSTQIEHKAVLEPLEFMAKRGFTVDFVPPRSDGWMDPSAIKNALRNDTLLVSVMQANNETGTLQPIAEIADHIQDHDAYFHVDAAQAFGKEIATLQNKRIDFISISGHKIFGPKGIGSLITRRREYVRPPLQPLMFGGGQERSLRPGTLPVSLIVGLGVAAELALQNHAKRSEICRAIRGRVMDTIDPFKPTFNGDLERSLPHTLNLSFAGIDSEALMVALKDEISFSNGSACTSHSYTPSHVLNAMGLDKAQIQAAVRLSWCHLSDEPDWNKISKIIKSLL